MKAVLSDADLNYCVGRGIISKSDKRFFMSAASVSKSLKGYYSDAYNKLNEKLCYYSGIAERVSVAKEQVSRKNQLMRDSKSRARAAYAQSVSQVS